MPFDGVIDSTGALRAYKATPADLADAALRVMALREAVVDLKAARRLITPSWRWTTGKYHRVKTFLGIRYSSRCAIGAMQAVKANRTAYLILYQATPRPTPNQTAVEDFNDTSTHSEVLMVFSAAISTAQVRLKTAMRLQKKGWWN